MTKNKKPYKIVLEGLDGAGKATATDALYNLLISKGYKVKKVAFPMYDKWHSFLVRFFLKGKFGKSPYSVPPIIAALFYAIDRFFGYHFGIKSELDYEEDLNGSPYDFLIFDRYTTSSMLYQGAKGGKTFHDMIRVAKIIRFIEYKIFRLPVPDKIFVLMTNAEQSKNAMKNRETLDINEADMDYQITVRDFLNKLIRYYPWFPIATRKENYPFEWYLPEDIAELMFAHLDFWALGNKHVKIWKINNTDRD